MRNFYYFEKTWVSRDDSWVEVDFTGEVGSFSFVEDDAGVSGAPAPTAMQVWLAMNPGPDAAACLDVEMPQPVRPVDETATDSAVEMLDNDEEPAAAPVVDKKKRSAAGKKKKDDDDEDYEDEDVAEPAKKKAKNKRSKVSIVEVAPPSQPTAAEVPRAGGRPPRRSAARKSDPSFVTPNEAKRLGLLK